MEKNIIQINLNSDTVCTRYSLSPNFMENSYILQISANPRDSYKTIRNNKKLLLQSIKEECEEMNKAADFIFEEAVELSQKVLDGKISLFEDIGRIDLEGDFKDIKHFIDSSPELSKIKLILTNLDSLDIDKLREAYKYLGEYSNIYCRCEGDQNFRTLSELIKAAEIIDSKVNQIKLYDYSPFEQLIYAFDLVRDRKYLKAHDDADGRDSRDLTSVLLNDEIVCEGFANIFEAIGKKLDFKVIKVFLQSKEDNVNGHAVNAVYLKDDKYGIEGIYYVDITQGRKIIGNDFLNSYLALGKTKTEYEFYTMNKYTDKTFIVMDKNVVKKSEEYLVAQQNLPYDYRRTFCRISNFVGDEKFLFKLVVDDTKGMMESIQRYYTLFNTPIDSITFLKALYTVRKNEYYEDSEKYEFSEEKLFAIMINSGFVSKKYIAELILSKMFETNPECDKLSYLKDEFAKYSDEFELGKKVEQIKVAKVLRKVLESKTNK